MDFYDNQTKERVNKISLSIEILRTKKERSEECAYGPGEESFGHKCKHCENDGTICLSIGVDFDSTGSGYVTSDKYIFKAIAKICEDFLILNKS